jgi:membrane protein implicated in regulation of membrane protease activity
MSALGLLLVVIGVALLVAEAHAGHGAFGTAGALALALGVAFALIGAGAVVGVALAAGLGVAAACAGWLWLVVRKAMGTRRLRVRNGLVGRVGVVRAVPEPVGQVFVDGALWRARLWGLEDGAPLVRGDPIVVEHVDGLTLTVRPAEEWEVAP